MGPPLDGTEACAVARKKGPGRLAISRVLCLSADVERALDRIRVDAVFLTDREQCRGEPEERRDQALLEDGRRMWMLVTDEANALEARSRSQGLSRSATEKAVPCSQKRLL